VEVNAKANTGPGVPRGEWGYFKLKLMWIRGLVSGEYHARTGRAVKWWGDSHRNREMATFTYNAISPDILRGI
jgi:hypothetical protein